MISRLLKMNREHLINYCRDLELENLFLKNKLKHIKNLSTVLNLTGRKNG